MLVEHGNGLEGAPSLWFMTLFGVGALVMQGAGCVVNDLADRNFDSMVARTALAHCKRAGQRAAGASIHWVAVRLRFFGAPAVQCVYRLSGCVAGAYSRLPFHETFYLLAAGYSGSDIQLGGTCRLEAVTGEIKHLRCGFMWQGFSGPSVKHNLRSPGQGR